MLTIEHHEKYGWTVTKPTEELIDYIINKGWEDIMMNRASFPFPISGGRKGKSTGEDGTETTKPKSNSRKYVCPKCKTIIRATRAVNVVCGDRDIPFELEV